MAELDINQIKEYLHHRYPFLFLDRVLDYEPGIRGTAIKNVTANEPFFQGHFPGRPIMPGVLMIEAVAQLGAVVLGTELEAKTGKASKVMGYFASVKEFKFKQPVIPGDQLVISIEFTGRKRRIYMANGKVEIVGGKLAARGRIMLALLDD